jgi:hypothetical protein
MLEPEGVGGGTRKSAELIRARNCLKRNAQAAPVVERGGGRGQVGEFLGPELLWRCVASSRTCSASPGESPRLLDRQLQVTRATADEDRNPPQLAEMVRAPWFAKPLSLPGKD